MAGAQQHTAVNAAALARGQAELERVIQRAERGQDAFQHQPIAKAKVAEPDAVNTEDPDIAQFERFIQRYGNNMLVLAYVVAQAFSWVLIKVRLPSTARGHLCVPEHQFLATPPALAACRVP